MPLRVLVLCTGNSCRSQMAEALLRRAGGGELSVFSAGTHPTAVNPLTIRALAEVGLDIRAARSKPMTQLLDQPFYVVVTVCDDAREACPVFPGDGRRVHVPFVDPALAVGDEEARLAVFRQVRDGIAAWAEPFAARLVAGADAAHTAAGLR